MTSVLAVVCGAVAVALLAADVSPAAAPFLGGFGLVASLASSAWYGALRRRPLDDPARGRRGYLVLNAACGLWVVTAGAVALAVG